MKAIAVHEFGEPEVMKLEDVPDPAPGAGQVVVKVHAVGVNPADAYVRGGLYGSLQMPYTPGSDAAGVVEAVGEGVTTVSVGERVYVAGTISGAYAERALCEASQVHHLPDRMSFAQGAALGVPYGTAYHALFQRAGAVAGDAVLVHGASGGVGVPVVQYARAAGMMVVGTAGTDRGRQLAIEQGSHHAIDHRDPAHFEQALALTGGRGFDVIIEFLADVNLAGDLRILARWGRVAVVGSRGAIEIDPREMMGRESEIRGVTLMLASQQQKAGIFAAIGAGLENGTLRPVVGDQLPLGEAARAHHEIMEKPAYGKKVLVP